MWWRGCRRAPSVLRRRRDPCSSAAVAGEWWGHGLLVLVWCGASRGGVPWGGFQGFPQACAPWRAPVAGASSRSRRRAVGHWTPEGRRSLSFLRPPLGRSRCAPVVAMRPPHPGGLAVLQLGWGTPWCTSGLVRWPVPVSGTGIIAPRSRGGGVGAVVPPPLAQAFGQPRPPLAACSWRAVPPAVGRPLTLGGRWRKSWALRLLPGGGLCETLPVARARLAWEWGGCAPDQCGASWTGVRDRW